MKQKKPTGKLRNFTSSLQCDITNWQKLVSPLQNIWNMHLHLYFIFETKVVKTKQQDIKLLEDLIFTSHCILQFSSILGHIQSIIWASILPSAMSGPRSDLTEPWVISQRTLRCMMFIFLQCGASCLLLAA